MSMRLLYMSLMFMGSEVLFIGCASCVVYSVGSVVKRVHVVLSGLRKRLVVCVHVKRMRI